jgi:hypothetical protein
MERKIMNGFPEAQYFGARRIGEEYERIMLPHQWFDSYTERQLQIFLISRGLMARRIKTSTEKSADFDIGIGYVIETTNIHVYHPSEMTKLVNSISEWGRDKYVRMYGLHDGNIEYDIIREKTLSNRYGLVRLKSDVYTYIRKIKAKIRKKYSQCNKYDKLIINMNFITTPFDALSVYKCINNILIGIGYKYPKLAGIMIGIPYINGLSRPNILSYFIIRNFHSRIEIPRQLSDLCYKPSQSKSREPILIIIDLNAKKGWNPTPIPSPIHY